MPPTISPIFTPTERRKGNRPATTVINVAGRETPILEYLKHELRLCPYLKCELPSASGATFTLLKIYASVYFVPFMGYKETEKSRNEHERNRLKRIFKCFKDATTEQEVHYQNWNEILAEKEQKRIIAEFADKLFHNWKDVYADRNEPILRRKVATTC